MEELEHLATWLVHDGNDDHAIPDGEVGDAVHHVERGGTVEPAMLEPSSGERARRRRDTRWW